MMMMMLQVMAVMLLWMVAAEVVVLGIIESGSVTAAVGASSGADGPAVMTAARG